MANKVPAVRFKGFDDEWESKLFSNVATRISTQGNKVGLPRVEFEDIVSGKGLLNKNIFNKSCNKKGVHFKPNDTLFGKLRPYLKNWLLAEFEGVAVGDFWVLRSIDCDSKFLYSLIQSDNYQTVANLSTGTKMPRSDWNVVSNTKFEIPFLVAEQTLIGNFFKQMDERIALQRQELDALKSTKQGFLQKMFPAEDETVPQLRFPGFSGEWEEKTLAEHSAYITKGTTPKDKSGIGEINYIKVENIYNGNIFPKNKITENEHNNYLKRSILEENDILFSIAGTLGRIAIVTKTILPANTNQALAIIRGYNFDKNFLITTLSGRFVSEYIRRNPTIGAQPNLSLEQVGKLIIWSPCMEEQTLIGNFFKKLDDTIALHQQELDALEQTKKAFLQKMFI